jgi:hypothetical protein
MSLVCGRRGRLIGVLAWLALAAAVSAPAQADTFTIRVDQAKLLKLPERVATIVIGNPLIADATLQSGGLLVITGKGYGATNLMALDRGGQVLMEKSVRVLGPGGKDVVVVYKGIDRETYSCGRDCLPRITLGDSTAYFNAALAATGTRSGQAQGSAGGGASGAAPAAR